MSAVYWKPKRDGGLPKIPETAKPRRKRAYSIAKNARMRGHIVPGPCALADKRCTKRRPIEMHHTDYGANEVVWLCKRHHMDLHYGKVALPMDLEPIQVPLPAPRGGRRQKRPNIAPILVNLLPRKGPATTMIGAARLELAS